MVTVAYKDAAGGTTFPELDRAATLDSCSIQIWT